MKCEKINRYFYDTAIFSMLVSPGGCESQGKGHIQRNMGNHKDTSLAVVTQLLPYIGYLRTLNTIACLNEVIQE